MTRAACLPLFPLAHTTSHPPQLSPLTAVLPAATTTPPPLPSLPFIPPVGPQRVLAPTRIASSPEGGAGSGSHSPVTGSAWDGLAADGGDGKAVTGVEADHGGGSGAGDREVEITTAVIHTAPHAPSTPGPLTLPELQGLPHTTKGLLHTLAAAVLKVIGDGRCSVASLLLALGFIPLDHYDAASKAVIDDGRRGLGHSMHRLWRGEREWVEEVPTEVRMANARVGEETANKSLNTLVQSSYDRLYETLTVGPPTTWLDHAVFYLASRQYDVGIFIVVPGRSGVPLYCRHIGAHRKQHIVLLHRAVHYECVRWGDATVFSLDHPLASRLVLLAQSHPPATFKEDDMELLHLHLQVTAPQPPTLAPEALEKRQLDAPPAAADETYVVKRSSPLQRRQTRGNRRGTARLLRRRACHGS